MIAGILQAYVECFIILKYFNISLLAVSIAVVLNNLGLLQLFKEGFVFAPVFFRG